MLEATVYFFYATGIKYHLLAFVISQLAGLDKLVAWNLS